MKRADSMDPFLTNPRYRGKHLIFADGILYTAKTGEKALEILEKVRKKNPNAIPEVAYMPKGKIWIL